MCRLLPDPPRDSGVPLSCFCSFRSLGKIVSRREIEDIGKWLVVTRKGMVAKLDGEVRL